MARTSNYLVHAEYLRFVLKRNQRFMLLMSIAMLVLFPILYLTTLNLSEYQNIDSLRTLGQVFTLVLLIISAFLLPIILFDYLNHKKDLDVYHALPIQQSHLLMIHALASIILMWIPFTLSWWIGNSISLTLNFTLYDVLITYISSLSVSLVIISVVSFALMHVGTALNGLLYAVLLNILPLLVYLSYNLLRSILFLGFNTDFSLKAIGMMFPIWALFENIYTVENSFFQNALISSLYWLSIGLALYFFSQQAYKYRQHEKAESAFTNSFFYPVVSSVFMVIVIFILYGAFYSSTSINQGYFNPINFVFPFFFAGVIYVVMDTISQRNFRNLFKAMLRYCVIAMVGFSLLIVGLITRGFGAVTYMPDIDDIDSITFEMDDYVGMIFPYNYTYEQYIENINEVLVSDEIGIQTILSFHQTLLDEYAWIDYSTTPYYGEMTLIDKIESSKNYVQTYTSYPFEFNDSLKMNTMRISMIYHLKNGKSVARSYNVPYPWTYELYDLYASDAILNYSARSLVYLEDYSKLTQASLRVFGNDSLTLITSLDLTKLKEVYLEDMKTFTADDFREIKGPLLATLNLITENETGDWFESDIVISESTPNTLNYLRSLTAFPEVALNFQEAYLILPTEQDDSLLHRRASSQTQYLDYDYELNQSYRYVSLRPEHLKAIYPYTAYTGFSNEALIALRVLSSSENNITLDDYYSFGNYLIKAEYTDEVMKIIEGLEVEISTDIYTIMPK